MVCLSYCYVHNFNECLFCGYIYNLFRSRYNRWVTRHPTEKGEKWGMGIGRVVWMDRKDAICRYVQLFVCDGIHVVCLSYCYIHNFNICLSAVLYIIYSTHGTADG